MVISEHFANAASRYYQLCEITMHCLKLFHDFAGKLLLLSLFLLLKKYIYTYMYSSIPV